MPKKRVFSLYGIQKINWKLEIGISFYCQSFSPKGFVCRNCLSHHIRQIRHDFFLDKIENALILAAKRVECENKFPRNNICNVENVSNAEIKVGI